MDSYDEPLKPPAHGFAYPALCLHGKGIASWVDSTEKPTLQVRFDGKQVKRVTKVHGWLSKERYTIDKQETKIPCQRCLAKMTGTAIPVEQEAADCLNCNTNNLVIGH
jgi:hypothetical protein